MREVQIEDLLGREPIKLDNQRVNEFVRGKVVLVTGGGGFDRIRALPPDSGAGAEKADNTGHCGEHDV